MTGYLHHKLSRLHQSLLHGTLPLKLHWSDALELIRHLGQVELRGQDEFAFIVGNQRELFKRSHTPEFGIHEISRLRKFLENAQSESGLKI
jgi:hypothetical protein